MGAAASIGEKAARKYRESSKQKYPKKYDSEELEGSNGTFETDEATQEAKDRPQSKEPPPVNTRTHGYRPTKESTASSTMTTTSVAAPEGTGSAAHPASGKPSKERQDTNRDERGPSKKKEQLEESGYCRGSGSKVLSGNDMNAAATQVRVLRRASTTGLHQAHSRDGILKERRTSSVGPMGGLSVGMIVIGTSKAGQELGAGTVIGAGNTPGMVMVRMEVSGKEMALSAARLQAVEKDSHAAAQIVMEQSKRRHSIA